MRSLTYLNPNGVSQTFQFAPMITSLEGIDQPKIGLQTQKAPFQDGSTLIDELYEERVITMKGVIAGTLASIMTQRNAIHAALNPKLGLGTITLTTDAGAKLIYGIPSAVVFPNKEATSGFQEFYIEFTCPDPYFYDTTPTSLSWNYVTSNWKWPMTYPVVFSYGGGAQLVTNVGHAQAPISGIFYGPATNPKVKCVNTGAYLRVLITMVAGDQLAFNTTPGQKSLIYTPNGGAAVSAMNKLDINSQFWMLGLGENTVQFSDDTANQNARITLNFSNRFLGV